MDIQTNIIPSKSKKNEPEIKRVGTQSTINSDEQVVQEPEKKNNFSTTKTFGALTKVAGTITGATSALTQNTPARGAALGLFTSSVIAENPLMHKDAQTKLNISAKAVRTAGIVLAASSIATDNKILGYIAVATLASATTIEIAENLPKIKEKANKFLHKGSSHAEKIEQERTSNRDVEIGM